MLYVFIFYSYKYAISQSLSKTQMKGHNIIARPCLSSCEIRGILIAKPYAVRTE